MSHKASAYMRELTQAPNGEFLTRNEKLFGLILADYHQAGTRHTFPSLATLAADCLMDERMARRVLQSMERKGVVRRIRPVFQYRGITSFYIFPEIDKEGAVAPLPTPKKEGTVAPLKNCINGLVQKEGRRRAEGGQKGGKITPLYKKEELVTVTSNTPLPPASGGKPIAHKPRRFTRRQRAAQVGVYNPERNATPWNFPDDPRAQELSDRNPQDLTIEELSYLFEAQAREKEKRLQQIN